jgi:hypothetical protein
VQRHGPQSTHRAARAGLMMTAADGRTAGLVRGLGHPHGMLWRLCSSEPIPVLAFPT